MASPVEVVKAFLGMMGESNDALHESHRKYFTEKTVWENVGVITTTGVDDAIAFIRRFEEQTGFVTLPIKILSIAADGNNVLTERIDTFLDANGKVVGKPLRVMGRLTVEGDKIVHWSDYFDTAGLGVLDAK